jgi:hypothetical protein
MNTQFETTKNHDEWLTPPEIIKSLGSFYLDPCSPVNRPWDTALHHYTVKDNGLIKPWVGRVWCNPPYGNQTKLWLEKCCSHNNCIVLIFARTETKMFFDYIWDQADALLFIKGRLRFCNVLGEQCETNAGAPSVLVAYGDNNAAVLKNSKIQGKFIQLNK